ncbi:hypothetical protein H310_01092 [Aphanomyces invadans]|uniref:Spore protein YkvP/CgeB glycosyl transferase-like domain-containing protein n=1 Tax=Aphanomyces invadans TaxID=157072 RepID=A0A024UQG3_9STRA|nr:hypothetical protein H310_01092 [Aphanomyces invadans]ETW08529.1 hypothetical protein H310_01092 [Aphanomyces invadans]|eukprot:XP_008862334.1 hypothetical protein H310_01092 [Aphanomyces invadans]
MLRFLATVASTTYGKGMICDELSSSTCIQRLHVALHAQAHSSNDHFVVGSEMTCRGFGKAFGAQGHHVQMMYPGSYSSIADHSWDIVFIEGWFPAIVAFIHEIRRLTQGHAKIYFFCLDPDFPGLDTIQQLDVDAFFSNSHDALRVLQPHAPHSEFMLLAAEPPSSAGFSRDSSSLNVVYVGNVIGINTKRDLADMLREAIPFGLTIYGYAWDLVPEFTPYWGGILPPEDLPRVYATARVVLGATMDGQRRSGMINNRVFEVLAAGAILINDHYEALEQLLEDRILYYSKPGDVARHLLELSSFPYSPVDLQAFVRSAHTYNHRVRQILAAHFSLSTRHSCTDRLHCPKFVVVLDEHVMTSNFLVSLFVQEVLLPALENLRNYYHVRLVSSVGEVMAMTDLGFHDFVLALSCWNCPIDFDLRQSAVNSLMVGKGMYLLRPPPIKAHDLDFYDVLFVTSPLDGDVLLTTRTNRQHAFGVPNRGRHPARTIADSTCEWMALGDWTDDAQRLVHILDNAVDSSQPNVTTVVVFPDHSKLALAHTVAYLQATQPRLIIRFATRPSQVLEMLMETYQCNALYLPATDEVGGGDWVVAIAATLGLTLHVQPDTSRWSRTFVDVLNSTWDLQYVTNAFRLGMTQRLCLGHGGAFVRMVWPLDGAVVGESFDVSFETERFEIPRDGSVCLFVNDQVKGCLVRPNLSFAVEWPDQKRNDMLVLELTLRSNIYGNDFAKTEPVTVLFGNGSQETYQIAVDPVFVSNDRRHELIDPN